MHNYIYKEQRAFSLGQPAPSFLGRLALSLRPPKPLPDRVAAQLYTPARLLFAIRDRVHILQFAELAGQPLGICFRARDAIRAVHFCYNKAQIHYYEYLVVSHSDGLHLYLFDFVKRNYRPLHWLPTNQPLLVQFTADTELVFATSAALYRLSIANSKLVVQSKNPFGCKLSSVVMVHYTKNQFIGLVEDRLQLFELTEGGLETRGEIVLGGLKEEVLSGVRIDEGRVAVQLRSTVLLLKFLVERWQIYNSFDLGQSQPLWRSCHFNIERGAFVVHKAGRIEFFRFSGDQLVPVELVPVGAESECLQVVFQHEGLMLGVFCRAAEGWNEVLLTEFRQSQSLQEKAQSILSFRDLSIAMQERVMCELGMSSADFFKLAWENSEYNQFAIEKILVRIGDYKYYKKAIKTAFVAKEARGEKFSTALLLKIHKAGHDEVLRNFGRNRSTLQLKYLLKSAFLVKKLTFCKMANSELSSAEYRQLKKRSVLDILKGLVDSFNVAQFLEFINNYKLTLTFHYEVFLRHVFAGVGKDIVKLSSEFFYLLPCKEEKERAALALNIKFCMEHQEKLRLEELSQVAFVVFNDLWTTLRNYEWHYYFTRERLRAELLRHDPEILFAEVDQLIAACEGEPWYSAKRLINHEGFQPLQPILQKTNYLCRFGSYIIYAELVAREAGSLEDTLKVLASLEANNRYDHQFSVQLKYYAEVCFFLQEHGIERNISQLVQLDDQVIRCLLDHCAQRFLFHKCSLDRLVDFICRHSEKLPFLLSLDCQEPLLFDILKGALRKLPILHLRGNRELVLGKQLFSPEEIQSTCVCSYFLPQTAFQTLEGQPYRQTMRQILNAYEGTEFNRAEVAVLEGVQVPLNNLNNVVTVLLYLDQKKSNVGAELVLETYFECLLSLGYFDQIDQFIAVQQENLPQLCLSSILLRAAGALFNELMQAAPSFLALQQQLTGVLQFCCFDQEFYFTRKEKLRLCCLVETFYAKKQYDYFTSPNMAALFEEVRSQAPSLLPRLPVEALNEAVTNMHAIDSVVLTQHELLSCVWKMAYAVMRCDQSPEAHVRRLSNNPVQDLLLIWLNKTLGILKFPQRLSFFAKLLTAGCEANIEFVKSLRSSTAEELVEIGAGLKQEQYQTPFGLLGCTVDQHTLFSFLRVVQQLCPAGRKGELFKLCLFALLCNIQVGLTMLAFQTLWPLSDIQKSLRPLAKLVGIRVTHLQYAILKLVVLALFRKTIPNWQDEFAVLGQTPEQTFSQEFSRALLQKMASENVTEDERMVIAYYYVNVVNKQLEADGQAPISGQMGPLLIEAYLNSEIKVSPEGWYSIRLTEWEYCYESRELQPLQTDENTSAFTLPFRQKSMFGSRAARSESGLFLDDSLQRSQVESNCQLYKQFSSRISEPDLSYIFGPDFFTTEFAAQEGNFKALFRSLKPSLIRTLTLQNWLPIANAFGEVLKDQSYRHRTVVYRIEKFMGQGEETAKAALEELPAGYLGKGRKLQKLREKAQTVEDQGLRESLLALYQSKAL